MVQAGARMCVQAVTARKFCCVHALPLDACILCRSTFGTAVQTDTKGGVATAARLLEWQQLHPDAERPRSTRLQRT